MANRPTLEFSMERDNDLIVVLRQYGQRHVFLKDKGDDKELPEPVLVDGAKSVSGVLSILQHLLPGEMAKTGEEGMTWLKYTMEHVRPVAKKGEAKWTKIQNELNAHLSSHAWLASSDEPTIADVLLFANLYHLIEKMSVKRMAELAYLTRFYSRAQSTLTNVAVPLLQINMRAVDDAVVNTVKEQLKQTDLNGAAKSKPKAAPAEGGAKKEKRVAPPPAEEVMEPFRIDLRVGKIVSAEKHPDADALYLEKIDFGEPNGPRTIISGLVNHVPLEEMQNRWVVCMCNLKPVSMRGIKSEGMVMCATSEDGRVAPLRVPEGSQLGDRVTFRGFPTGEPDAVLNPKKKVWETLKPFFKTNGEKVATFDREGKVGVMETDKGAVFSDFAVNAPIS